MKIRVPIPHYAAPEPFDVAAVEARRSICAACEWNLDWTCQNTACSVCPGVQRKIRAQPLLKLLNDQNFKCPLKKFTL